MPEEGKFKVDGMVFPSPSLTNQLHEWNRISRSYNNVRGDFIDKTVAQKDKFFWTYNSWNLEEGKELLAYLYNKIENNNSFQVTSWTPDRGFVTKTCYLGTPIGVTPIAADNGYPILANISLHWIQIDGSKKL